MKFDPTLYFITDSADLSERCFLDRIKSALAGGVTMVQLREKNRCTREYTRFARAVHSLTSSYGVPLIIDDRLDVALAADAEGVHLGKEDLSVEDARRLAPDGFIVGATAKTTEQALQAYEQGADYLGVGAIFPTTTKVKTVITSVSTLKDICSAVPIPVNAIGGLNVGNVDVLQGVAISGICVVSAIMKADDPQKSAKELLKKAKELVHDAK